MSWGSRAPGYQRVDQSEALSHPKFDLHTSASSQLRIIHTSRETMAPSQHRTPAYDAQPFEHACASLDLGSNVLAEAAASLSSALLDMQANAVSVRKKRRRPLQPKISPYFRTSSVGGPPLEQKTQKRKAKKTMSSQVDPQVSPYFAAPLCEVTTATADALKAPGLSTPADPFSCRQPPPGLAFDLLPALFGLIQERICCDLYALVVQAILWNKTRGVVACPVLWNILCSYPTPSALASARLADVEEIIRKLGLQQVRARRLVDMAITWVNLPPTQERRYGRRHYPAKSSNLAVKDGELLGPEDVREGWEIAHVPGVGEYALDSFRIFGRDRLRGIASSPDVEPEWKRLVPKDKELGPYVKWKWAQEGWDYDVATGTRRKM